jgi:hypothetical protein
MCSLELQGCLQAAMPTVSGRASIGVVVGDVLLAFAVLAIDNVASGRSRSWRQIGISRKSGSNGPKFVS